jgi:flagellar motor switch protein FliG
MSLSSSLTRAAVVVNSLSTDHAARVLSRLEPDDIKSVLAAISQLKHSTPLEVRNSIERFASETGTEINRRDHVSSNDSANSDPLESNTLGYRSVSTTCESELPFSFLKTVDHAIKLQLLQDEHPRNIALVLSCVEPETASDLISSLDPILRVTVLKRICELEELDPEEIAYLGFELKSRLEKLSGLEQEPALGIDVASRVLSGVDETVQYSLLAEIDQADPDMARFLKNSVLVFEDLERLDSGDLKLVLSQLDTSVWAPALKNANSSLQVRIFDVLAEKPAELLALEMDQLATVDQTSQQSARKTVVKAMLDLSLSGAIEFRKQLAG